MGYRDIACTATRRDFSANNLTLTMLKARGIQQIDIVEPNEHRRKLATLFGARRVMDSAEAQLDEINYPVGKVLVHYEQ